MNTLFVLILIVICTILFLLQFVYDKNVSNATISSENISNKQIDIDKTTLKDKEYKNNLLKKINPEILNPEILNKLGISTEDIKNFLLSSSPEPFEVVETFLSEKQSKFDIPQNISFKPIIANKLYYGLPCDYIKNDCFYDSLKLNGFVITNDILKACLIVPCSYETTEKEIIDLDKNNIVSNEYGEGVRIFMLNNTDHMVSKLALWKYLKQKYGKEIASTMLPYTWD